MEHEEKVRLENGRDLKSERELEELPFPLDISQCSDLVLPTKYILTLQISVTVTPPGSRQHIWHSWAQHIPTLQPPCNHHPNSAATLLPQKEAKPEVEG